MGRLASIDEEVKNKSSGGHRTLFYYDTLFIDTMLQVFFTK
jgi:hypothetical protein